MLEPIDPKPIMNNHNKFGAVVVAAFIFGIGWHIRGSGTSDVVVAIMLLLLFLSVIFSPRKKFNSYVFGIITLLIRALRGGWGTFAGQAGIPGIYNKGHYSSYAEGFDVIVSWWQGYFWLFIVGFAWSSLAALFIGGYIFTKKKRLKPYDFWMSIILFVVGWVLGLFIAKVLIPIISPDAYQVYIDGKSVRNYKSMRDNLSVATAIIPVLIYLGIVGKDWKFVGNSLMIMTFFGIGISVANIWQVIGRNNLDWNLPFWSLWEYFSGLIIGGTIMTFYYRKTRKLPETAEIGFSYQPQDTTWSKIWRWFITHFILFMFGIQESIYGALDGVFNTFGIETNVHTWLGFLIITILDIPLYILYLKGFIFKRFKQKSFQEKSIIWLIVLLPFYMLCYLIPSSISGSLTFQMGALVSYLDIVSFIIVESYLVVVYIRYKKQRS